MSSGVRLSDVSVVANGGMFIWYLSCFYKLVYRVVVGEYNALI